MALNFDLSNYRAPVTGVSSGIGAGIADLPAQAGCDVAGCGLEADDSVGAKHFVAAVQYYGRRAMYKALDISDSGVFDFMTAHFGDGEADLARQVGTYLRESPELADEFVQAYSDHKIVQPGFGKRQQLYMLYDSLLIWTFWQAHAGGLPENKTLNLEQWAGPFVTYWGKL
jgi:NAD(P)-dependent dehydrogenase (short-subunit alcohol dehydrogenase family)